MAGVDKTLKAIAIAMSSSDVSSMTKGKSDGSAGQHNKIIASEKQRGAGWVCACKVCHSIAHAAVFTG